MPSTTQYNYAREECYPCKWLKRKLHMSGRNPIYHCHCMHAKAQEHWATFNERGRFIGETDNRPSWCPIHGDKQAEAEANEGHDDYFALIGGDDGNV